MDMKSLLGKLPFNGIKSWLGVAAAALVLGLQSMGYIEEPIVGYLLYAITAWTGLAIYHKDLKAKE